jgi:hypothetical protein
VYTRIHHMQDSSWPLQAMMALQKLDWGADEDDNGQPALTGHTLYIALHMKMQTTTLNDWHPCNIELRSRVVSLWAGPQKVHLVDQRDEVDSAEAHEPFQLEFLSRPPPLLCPHQSVRLCPPQ